MIALSPRFTFLAALSTLAALSSFHVSDAAVLRSRDFVFPWIKVPGIDGGTLFPRHSSPQVLEASQKGKTVSGDSSERGEDDGKRPSDGLEEGAVYSDGKKETLRTDKKAKDKDRRFYPYGLGELRSDDKEPGDKVIVSGDGDHVHVHRSVSIAGEQGQSYVVPRIANRNVVQGPYNVPSLRRRDNSDGVEESRCWFRERGADASLVLASSNTTNSSAFVLNASETDGLGSISSRPPPTPPTLRSPPMRCSWHLAWRCLIETRQALGVCPGCTGNSSAGETPSAQNVALVFVAAEPVVQDTPVTSTTAGSVQATATTASSTATGSSATTSSSMPLPSAQSGAAVSTPAPGLPSSSTPPIPRPTPTVLGVQVVAKTESNSTSVNASPTPAMTPVNSLVAKRESNSTSNMFHFNSRGPHHVAIPWKNDDEDHNVEPESVNAHKDRTHLKQDPGRSVLRFDRPTLLFQHRSLHTHVFILYVHPRLTGKTFRKLKRGRIAARSNLQECSGVLRTRLCIATPLRATVDNTIYTKNLLCVAMQMQPKIQSSSTDVSATRQYGKTGRQVKVIANTFAIKTLPTQTIYHYDVVITPVTQRPGRDAAELNSRRGHEIVHRLQNITAPTVFNPRAFFDGKKNLFSVGPLKMQGNAAEFVVSMSDTPQPPGNTRGQFRVRLTKVNDINLSRCANELFTGGTDVSQIAVTFLQIVIRQAPMLKTGTFNSRSVFTDASKKSMSGGFNIWNGFFQSVRPTIRGLVINVDVSHAIVYEDMPVLDWACTYLSKFSLSRRRIQIQDLDRLSPDDVKLLKTVLRGVRVTVSVPAGRRPARPIKDLVPNIGGYAFMKGDEETTIRDYYEEKYGFRLRYPRLFGICVNVQQKTMVPAEICTIVGGRCSKRSPRERIEAIERGVNSDFLDYKNSPFFSQIGMQIDLRPMETSARLLPPPDIQFQGSVVDLSVQAQKANQQTGTHGAWNVMRRKFVSPAACSYWSVVSFAPQNFPLADVERSVMRLKQCCENLAVVLTGGRPASAAGGVERALEEAFAQLGAAINPLGLRERPPCLVLVVLPDSAAAQRKAVKAWGDVTRQVATQCVKTMKFKNANDQYYNNVALKINVKLGGINSYPISDIYTGLCQRPTMIVGVDVTHPGAGVRDRPSIASLVASVDHTFTRYAAFTKVQAPRMEVIEELEDMFFTALKYFLQRNNRNPPRRVIFYRDGVSEGEYQTVEEIEIKALSDAWDRFAQLPEAGIPKGYSLPLVFIVVGKSAARHHLRFFQGAGPNIKDKTGNIFGGLVVDKDVASPHKSDFYLQSHPGLKGKFNRSATSYVIHMPGAQDLYPSPHQFIIVCSRANFYLDESLGYSDLGSSGSFDLSAWRSGFKEPGPQNMYFI
ncbi:Piwi domain-containing protein [Lactifluus volemus]|nr:Piwi domain-containing protein [Lactifluus volemus]